MKKLKYFDNFIIEFKSWYTGNETSDFEKELDEFINDFNKYKSAQKFSNHEMLRNILNDVIVEQNYSTVNLSVDEAKLKNRLINIVNKYKDTVSDNDMIIVYKILIGDINKNI